MTSAPSKYEVLEPIDLGSAMVQRLRARQARLGREVEVRLSASPLPEGGLAWARWNRMLKALASADHPSLIKVLDTGMLGDRPYFVTDMRNAVSLRTLVGERRRRFTREDTIGMAEQIAGGLGQLHALGLALRDVRLETIFYDLDRDFPYVGHYDGLVEAGGATEADGASPCAAYAMVPEVRQGHPHGPAADLYMLADALCEMLTGTSVLDRAGRDREGRPRPGEDPAVISEALAGLPAPLREFLEGALAPKPEDRPADAETWARSLRHAVKRVDVAEELSRSVSLGRSGTPLDLSGSQTRPRARASPDRLFAPGDLLGSFGVRSLLLAVGAIALLWASLSLVAPSVPEAGDDGGPAGTGGPGVPRPRPARTVARGVGFEASRARLLAVAGKARTSPTRKEDFPERWGVLQHWFLYVPLRVRHKELFRHAYLLDTKVLFQTRPESACRRLDGLLEKAASFAARDAPSRE